MRAAARLALMASLLLCASRVWAQDKDLVRPCPPFTPGPATPARLVEPDGSRQALVVGISQYGAPEIPDLLNPPTDAARVAEALWRTGFEVRVCRDLGLAALEREVDGFLARREKAAVSVFYYSGHGGEKENENFLYPADIRAPASGFVNKDQVHKVALSVDRLSDPGKSAAHRTDVLILDACRTDPFSKGGGGGLAGEDANAGVIVAFSTQARTTALDSDIFSTSLAQSWTTPGLGLVDVFLQANSQAYSRYGYQQQPFLNIGAGVRNQPLVPAPEPVETVRAVPRPLGKVGDPPIGMRTGRVYTALEGRPEAMRFVQLSAGEFTMGSPETERGESNERPQHRVRVASAFYVGETEVTQGQWAVVVNEAQRQKWPEAAKLAAQRSQYTGDPARPVETVSWCDALRFANALSRMEELDPVYEVPEDCEQGRQVGLRAGAHPGFRLPLEAEWEYAARAGTEGRWWFGEEEAGLCTRGNVADEVAKEKDGKNNADWIAAPCSDGFTETAPVRRFSPNPWGLYDTIGNVWEWTEDAYAGDAYTKRKDGVEVDPRTATMALQSGDRLPVAAILAASDASRVFRGGGWYVWPFSSRSAFRDWVAPGWTRGNLGLRLVLAAAPGP